MPEISIICPVYNAEAYLVKCLDSLLAQTFRDWELIVVIDGSPDGSAGIAESYAAKDARIRIIHQENRGVSAARQTGLEAATGTYIIHADPDDWCEPGMLQELYTTALATGADVIICDFYVDVVSGQLVRSSQCPTALNASTVLRELFQQLHGSCWNKLAKRACYSKYGIRFPKNINYCEDLLTWVQFFQHDEVKIAYLPKAFYHYVQHERGITRAYTRETYAMRLRYQARLEELLAKENHMKEIRNSRLSIFREAFIHGVLSRREAWTLAWKNLGAIVTETRSGRWWVVYTCLLIGCLSAAKKVMKFHC